MPLSTLLVHLGPDALSAGRLAAAAGLARRHGAHLIGVHVQPDPTLGARGRFGSPVALAEIHDAQEETARKAEAEFRAATAELSAEWRAANGDAIEVLGRHALYADLALVSQSSAESLEDVVTGHMPDHLSLLAGCPTLVLPRAWAGGEIGTNVMIGWKAVRDAARAVRDALPILDRAECVTVITVTEAEDTDQPGDALRTTLARRGIKADLRVDFEGGSQAGQVMLRHCREVKADLLVMGAFGKPHWRELLLGGVTEQVLRHMHLPVLMSH